MQAQRCSPTVSEIYAYPIGSTFKYKISRFYEYGERDTILLKYTVTNTWQSNDTIYIERDVNERTDKYKSIPTDKYVFLTNNPIYHIVTRRRYIDTLIVVDSINHLYNGCTNDKINITIHQFYNFTDYSGADIYANFGITDSTKFRNNVYQGLFTMQNDTLKIDNSLDIIYKYTVQKGLGLVYQYIGHSYYWEISNLIGYTIDGISTGDVSDIPIHQWISLSSGWNLISVPIEPISSSIISVFNPIVTNVAIIKSSDGYYKPNLPNQIQSLLNIELGKSYLVKVNNPCFLLINGYERDSVIVSLNTGWNMLGYPETTTKDISIVLQDIWSQVQSIHSYTEYKDQTSGTLQSLLPGAGYYIYVTEPVNIIFRK